MDVYLSCEDQNTNLQMIYLQMQVDLQRPFDLKIQIFLEIFFHLGGMIFYQISMLDNSLVFF